MFSNTLNEKSELDIDASTSKDALKLGKLTELSILVLNRDKSIVSACKTADIVFMIESLHGKPYAHSYVNPIS